MNAKAGTTPLRVALSMRITEAQGYAEPRDSISHDWVARLEAWNMTPLFIPNGLKLPEKYLDDLNAGLLILTGGDDLGQTPVRDDTESALLAHAIGAGLPVLGVCRGLQLINRHFGGALRPVSGHVAAPHLVNFEGPLMDLYGANAQVNSYHEQGVTAEDLGEGLSAGGVDEDGFVEALHHRDHPVAAVMWHPERDQAPEGDRLLVTRLMEAGAFWT